MNHSSSVLSAAALSETLEKPLCTACLKLWANYWVLWVFGGNIPYYRTTLRFADTGFVLLLPSFCSKAESIILVSAKLKPQHLWESAASVKKNCDGHTMWLLTASHLCQAEFVDSAEAIYRYNTKTTPVCFIYEHKTIFCSTPQI